MACRLVALDKQPGVRPLGIGEVWRRGLAKCILVCCGEDATAACRSTNLCAGLEAGIEGDLHAVSACAALANTLDFGDWEVDVMSAETQSQWTVIKRLFSAWLTG